jgi:hypothetical protein
LPTPGWRGEHGRRRPKRIPEPAARPAAYLYRENDGIIVLVSWR